MLMMEMITGERLGEGRENDGFVTGSVNLVWLARFTKHLVQDT